MKIIASDPCFVIIDKPSGLLSVPGRGPAMQDCVVNRIKTLFPDCISQPSVHRLDMDTSGLMVVARTAGAHFHLSRQFEKRLVRKRYVALLEGVVSGEAGEITLAFRLDPDDRPHQIYDPIHGKIGITRWRLLETNAGRSRVEFTPLTGRTHQLRLHAAHPLGLGVPIVGDRLYGGGDAPGQLLLHASALTFEHPLTGKQVTWESPPPF